MCLLPRSAIRKPPAAVRLDVDRPTQLRARGGAAVSRVPGRAGARHGRDLPAGRDSTDAVVPEVGDKHAAVAKPGHRNGLLKRRRRRRSAIAAEARDARSGEREDVARRRLGRSGEATEYRDGACEARGTPGARAEPASVFHQTSPHRASAPLVIFRSSEPGGRAISRERPLALRPLLAKGLP